MIDLLIDLIIFIVFRISNVNKTKKVLYMAVFRVQGSCKQLNMLFYKGKVSQAFFLLYIYISVLSVYSSIKHVKMKQSQNDVDWIPILLYDLSYFSHFHIFNHLQDVALQ